LTPNLEFSADGRSLWYSKRDELCLWDLASQQPRRTIPQPKAGEAAVSPDGNRAAVVGENGFVSLWDVASAKKRFDLPGSKPRSGGLSFSPDGKRVVTWESDLKVRNWDANDGRLLSEFQPQANDRKFAGALSADGSRMVSYLKKFHLYDTATGKETGAFDGVADEGPFNSQRAKTSADGEWLLVGNEGGQRPITLYNLRLGANFGELKIEYARLNTALAMSANGHCFAVATGRPDAKIDVFETATVERRLTISLGYGEVTRLAFSPRGRYLAAAQTDGTVLVYDLLVQSTMN
jgi:WD40 repeat protein